MGPARAFRRYFTYGAVALLASHFLVACVLSIPEMATPTVAGDHTPVLSSQAWLGLIVANAAGLACASWLLARAQLAQTRRIVEEAAKVGDVAGMPPISMEDRQSSLELAEALSERGMRLATHVQRLEDEAAHLRAVLKSMAEGVLLVDAMQRIVFVNDAAGRLLNFALDDAPGKKLWQVARHRQLTDAVQQALVQDEPYRGEVKLPSPEARVLEIHAVRLPGLPVRGALLVFHDITHLRRLERMRQDFVANVSHELKTPLAAIQATVETLLDGALHDPEHGVLFLRRIGENADRLHRLVLDLLSLGQIESGEVSLDLESIDVANAVDACLKRQEHRAQAKALTLVQEAPRNPVSARADDDALAQILDNLVDNAIKYTPESGRIAVRWWEEDGEACIAIADTGVGIPEKDLVRVFERFYRVDKARSREVGGTGLGLSIVKHLTQALNGSIAATSQPGVGSTFTIRLPRATTDLARTERLAAMH